MREERVDRRWPGTQAGVRGVREVSVALVRVRCVQLCERSNCDM